MEVLRSGEEGERERQQRCDSGEARRRIYRGGRGWFAIWRVDSVTEATRSLSQLETWWLDDSEIHDSMTQGLRDLTTWRLSDSMVQRLGDSVA
ncbi:unnamed protein product [Arabis nemorensis]|uniref:Uncharacterized protein n=1 Tax=Arabis nemorensis TaxID=586526 RepID=A0A565APY4_9BRAS|nr:unnamed protein product [Arabis nemorensis]